MRPAPHPRRRRRARRRLDGAGVDRHAGGARAPARRPASGCWPIADELGYRPDIRARLLRRSRSRLLGVVFGVQHAFHGDLVGGLYAAADRVGLRAGAERGRPPGATSERAVGSLLQDRCEALVLLGPQAPTAYLADARRRGCPVVVVARRGAAPGGRRRAHATTRRARHGRRPPRRARAPAHRAHRRRPGARARPSGAAATPTRMHRHGLGRNARSCPAGSPRTTAPRRPAPCSADRSPHADRRHRRSTTAAPPACSTSCAARASRCPATSAWSASTTAAWPRLSHVDLTTIAQDAATMTELAVARAVARLDGAAVGEREQVVPPRLVVRGTTAPPAT